MPRASALLTNQIIQHIFDEGGYAWRASSTGIYDKQRGHFRAAPKKGVSDVLAVFRGHIVAIEVKIGTDTASPEQKGFLKNIVHHGGYGFIAKEFDDFKIDWHNIKVRIENKLC